MKETGSDSDETRREEMQPYRVRVPGFIEGEAIGLGELMKRVTRAMGIRPCGGCESRAARLNRRVVLYGDRK
jgi:hypothetical protein